MGALRIFSRGWQIRKSGDVGVLWVAKWLQETHQEIR